jgi:HSP20 family protein
MTKLILGPSHPRYVNRLPYLGSVTLPLMKTAFSAEEMPDHFRFMRPPANITESEKEFHIELAVPGFSREAISINNESNVLNVKGAGIDNQSEQKYHLRQFGISSFARSFRMPENAYMDSVEAIYNNGILKIVIAKVQKPEPRKIEIK